MTESSETERHRRYWSKERETRQREMRSRERSERGKWEVGICNSDSQGSSICMEIDLSSLYKRTTEYLSISCEYSPTLSTEHLKTFLI